MPVFWRPFFWIDAEVVSRSFARLRRSGGCSATCNVPGPGRAEAGRVAARGQAGAPGSYTSCARPARWRSACKPHPSADCSHRLGHAKAHSPAANGVGRPLL